METEAEWVLFFESIAFYKKITELITNNLELCSCIVFRMMLATPTGFLMNLHTSCFEYCFYSCFLYFAGSLKQWNWEAGSPHRPRNITGKTTGSLSDISVISEEAQLCLKIYFFLIFTHSTVEAPQTHACWQYLWKLQKCRYKNLCLVCVRTRKNPDTAVNGPAVHWKISVNWKVAVQQWQQ